MGETMVVLLTATIITCSDALNLIHRITRVVGLSEVQRTEIVKEIRKVVPSCPVKVVKND
jgi:hypothetical protein